VVNKTSLQYEDIKTMKIDNTANYNDAPDGSEEDLSTIDRLKQWLSESRQALESAGIAVIQGTYRGDGDEGNFEDAIALDGTGLPVPYSLPIEIVELMESLVDEVATPGYMDGDGGGGEIRLHVGTGSITHQSYFLSITCTYEDEATY
jgi:hypothetical protein